MNTRQLKKTGGIDECPNHLAGKLLKSMAGFRMTPIMYKWIGTAVIAALGNEVQATFVNIFVIQPHVRGGRLRALRP